MPDESHGHAAVSKPKSEPQAMFEEMPSCVAEDVCR